MPRGVPTLGSGSTIKLDSATEELLHAPEPKVIGTIPDETLTPPSRPTASWDSAGGVPIDLTEPPPPWESQEHHDTDARQFVGVPDNWVLRWINPRIAGASAGGMRWWEAVSASDPRVTVKNRALVAVDNKIRRGGDGGDFLAWMYRSWYDKRREIHNRKTDRLTQASIDRQHEVTERLRRGAFGPYVRDAGEGKHPTHTNLDGRSVRD